MVSRPGLNYRDFSSEVYRKAVHLSLGILAAFLPWWFTARQALLIIICFGALLVIIKFQGWLLSFYGVSRFTMGEVAFPVGVLVTYWLFFASHPLAYFYGVMIMAVADTAAAIIGQVFGKHYFHIFGVDKTWEGSIACFVVAFLLGLAVFSSHGEEWVEGILPSLLAAIGAAVAEALTGQGWDNFVLPVVASFLALALGLA